METISILRCSIQPGETPYPSRVIESPGLALKQSVNLVAGDLVGSERTLVDGAIGCPVWPVEDDPTTLSLLTGETTVKLAYEMAVSAICRHLESSGMFEVSPFSGLR